MTVDQPGDIRPGDIYEDCSFHPVLCIYFDGDEIGGISLIDRTACLLTERLRRHQDVHQ